MKRALVLSGGGAKGAFELGALEYIKEKHPATFDFQIIAGISVGSLNGAMLAQNKFSELQKLWSEISNDKVYTGTMPKTILQILWLGIMILFGRKSILGIDPLIKQIKDNISLRDIKADYRCGFVSLISGEYVACRHTQFENDDENFRNAILASCTMPIIWPPVEKVKIGMDIYEQLVDGGVRNVSPLKDVILDNPDEIIIVNLGTRQLALEPKAANNIFRIAERSLNDIVINEIFRSDIEEFVKTNDIVEQCEGKVSIYRDKERTEEYKKFTAVIIEPNEDLGDPLDFSEEKIKQRRRLGYEAAEAAFSKPKESIRRSYK